MTHLHVAHQPLGVLPDRSAPSLSDVPRVLPMLPPSENSACKPRLGNEGMIVPALQADQRRRTAG